MKKTTIYKHKGKRKTKRIDVERRGTKKMAINNNKKGRGQYKQSKEKTTEKKDEGEKSEWGQRRLGVGQ